MDDYIQPDAPQESYPDEREKSPQQRWNERNRKVLQAATKRWRFENDSYLASARRHQSTYRKKLKDHKAQHPTEPDPWLSL